MEAFYFLFEDLNNWSVWDEKGFLIGFLIMVITTVIFTSLYYLYFGRKNMKFATLGKWFLFGLLNLIVVFISTLFIEGITVFNLEFGSFFLELWLFTIINSLYGFVLYFLLSLLFKRFSIFPKYIPVKF